MMGDVGKWSVDGVACGLAVGREDSRLEEGVASL